MNIIDKFYEHCLKHCGGTISIYDGSTPATGYMVGCHPETAISGELSRKQLESFISANYDVLRFRGQYLGVWYDGNNQHWVYDVSTRFTLLENAMKAARSFDQDAIYDLAEDKCHDVL